MRRGWALVLAVVITSPVARADQWQQYRLGDTTYYNSNDGWRGSSYNLGGQHGTTYSDFYGPNGQTKHCSSYALGNNVYTNCY